MWYNNKFRYSKHRIIGPFSCLLTDVYSTLLLKKKPLFGEKEQESEECAKMIDVKAENKTHIGLIDKFQANRFQVLLQLLPDYIINDNGF